MNEKKDLMNQESDGVESYRTQAVLAPPVDIYENESQILLVADLPGVSKENLKINLDKNTLTLEGLRKLDTGGGEVSDFDELDYRRMFTVPNGIDTEKISANLSDGVLKLNLPKRSEFKPRQIEIKAG